MHTLHMENTTTPGALTALARYEQAVRNFAPTGAFWAGIASALRVEAETFTGGLRQKRLDRADDCDARARRAQLATAMLRMPDFVPMVAGGAL